MRRARIAGAVLFGLVLPACNDSAVNQNSESPIAEAGDNRTAGVNAVLSFDGSASYDPDGSIVGYEWDFGDGSTNVGQAVNHAYTAPGEYTVTLTVTDDEGLTGEDSPVVTVEVGAYEGTYAVQSTPQQQSCGGVANVSFVATNVVVTTTANGTAMISDWGLEGQSGVTVVEAPNGPLNGASFVQNWTYTYTGPDPTGGFCPNTPNITQTYSNAWTGTFTSTGGAMTISSQLVQDISDDCGILNCVITWPDVHGTRIAE